MAQFEDPQVQAARQRLRTGRNAPCPCGSGRKYKKCCLPRDESLVREADALRWEQETARARLTAEPATDLDWMPRDGPAAPLWQELRGRRRPPPERIDEIVDELLALPADDTPWRLLIETLEELQHPDLPGVIRRILDRPAPSPPAEGEFYVTAALLLARHDQRALLPELAERYRRVSVDGYHADEFFAFADTLLLEGFEELALDLAEHFFRKCADGSVHGTLQRPGLARLIFVLRAGAGLRADEPPGSLEAVAGRLSRDVGEDLDAGHAQAAAAVICGRAPPLTREAFDLPDPGSGDGPAGSRDVSVQTCLATAAREAWQHDALSPAATLRGACMICAAAARRRSSRPRHRRHVNLLDYLRPAGMENRLEHAAPDLFGSGASEAELVLHAYRSLLAVAARHGLIGEADAAASAGEIEQLALMVNPWRAAAAIAQGREAP